MYIYYHFVFSTRCSLRYIRVVFFPMNNITLSGDYIFQVITLSADFGSGHYPFRSKHYIISCYAPEQEHSDTLTAVACTGLKNKKKAESG